MQSQDPLRSRFVLARAPDKPTPPTSAPVPRRLGILHLLVWTACVALYMGLASALEGSTSLLEETTGRFRIAAGVLYGIGWGTALAGVVLMMARSYCGHPFPVYPGEYLWVLTGLDVVVRLATTILLLLVLALSKPVAEAVWLLRALQLLAAFGLYVWVFSWVVTRVKMRRWRTFFLVIPASYGIWLGLLYGGFDQWTITRYVPQFLIATTLTGVALIDLVDRRRYSWTHWFGVGTRLWLAAPAVGCFVCYALFGQYGFI
jgi:hypothetical protein